MDDAARPPLRTRLLNEARLPPLRITEVVAKVVMAGGRSRAFAGALADAAAPPLRTRWRMIQGLVPWMAQSTYALI